MPLADYVGKPIIAIFAVLITSLFTFRCSNFALISTGVHLGPISASIELGSITNLTGEISNRTLHTYHHWFPLPVELHQSSLIRANETETLINKIFSDIGPSRATTLLPQLDRTFEDLRSARTACHVFYAAHNEILACISADANTRAKQDDLGIFISEADNAGSMCVLKCSSVASLLSEMLDLTSDTRAPAAHALLTHIWSALSMQSADSNIGLSEFGLESARAHLLGARDIIEADTDNARLRHFDRIYSGIASVAPLFGCSDSGGGCSHTEDLNQQLKLLLGTVGIARE